VPQAWGRRHSEISLSPLGEGWLFAGPETRYTVSDTSLHARPDDDSVCDFELSGMVPGKYFVAVFPFAFATSVTVGAWSATSLSIAIPEPADTIVHVVRPDAVPIEPGHCRVTWHHRNDVEGSSESGSLPVHWDPGLAAFHFLAPPSTVRVEANCDDYRFMGEAEVELHVGSNVVELKLDALR